MIIYIITSDLSCEIARDPAPSPHPCHGATPSPASHGQCATGWPRDLECCPDAPPLGCAEWLPSPAHMAHMRGHGNPSRSHMKQPRGPLDPCGATGTAAEASWSGCQPRPPAPPPLCKPPYYDGVTV